MLAAGVRRGIIHLNGEPKGFQNGFGLEQVPLNNTKQANHLSEASCIAGHDHRTLLGCLAQQCAPMSYPFIFRM